KYPPDDGNLELPAEERAADPAPLGDLPPPSLAVGPVRRLAGSRHETPPLLAGRLGDELLGPETEPPVGGIDADLVAPFPPPVAALEAQLQTGTRFAATRLRPLHGPAENPLAIDPH